MTDLNLNECIILIVEDDFTEVLFIEQAFDRANLTNSLQVIADGDSAVDYLAGVGAYLDRVRYPMPALILLDLTLPRRSGLEVLKWLQQQLNLQNLPIVVLTTSKENADINHAYNLGANSYLIKPVTPGDLLGVIKTLNLDWLISNENLRQNE